MLVLHLVLHLVADCGAALRAIHRLYRGRLHALALHASPRAMAAAAAAGPAVRTNSCVARPSALGWLPAEAFDGVVSMGALGRLRSRRRVCAAFREMLQVTSHKLQDASYKLQVTSSYYDGH